MASDLKSKRKQFRYILKNRSLDYQRYGRYLVSDFDYRTLFLRLIGQLGDTIIMVLPVILWVDLFLLVAGGVVGITLLYRTMFATSVLILISIVTGNTYLSVILKGQSFGKWALRMKVVDMENCELDRNTLIIREAIGKAIPIILLYIFFGLLGVFGFLLLNGLVVMIDRPYHRSIIDIILKTKVVLLSDKAMNPVEMPKSEKKVVEEPKSENKIDLHINSSFSHDGEYEVEDLFKQAKKVGLRTISICDHNSVKANLIANHVAALYGIEYVPGINIDCTYKGYSVRLLGYFVNSNDPRFIAIEHENLAKEKAVSMRRIQLFEEFTGLLIDSEHLIKHSRFQVIAPELIARQILTNVKYQKNPILQPYLNGNRKDQPIQNFVTDFFAPGAPAYVSIVHPSLEDMIAAVRASGGVCVLAHPMYTFQGNMEVIEEIIHLPIQGLEVFSPRHSLQDIQKLLALAKKYKLDVTGGSEYHGESKKQFVLGRTTCPLDAEVIVQNFIDKYKTHTSK